jgi:hypothetical protein
MGVVPRRTAEMTNPSRARHTELKRGKNMEVSSHDKGIDFPAHWNAIASILDAKQDNASLHLSGRSGYERMGDCKEL